MPADGDLPQLLGNPRWIPLNLKMWSTAPLGWEVEQHLDEMQVPAATFWMHLHTTFGMPLSSLFYWPVCSPCSSLGRLAKSPLWHQCAGRHWTAVSTLVWHQDCHLPPKVLFLAPSLPSTGWGGAVLGDRSDFPWLSTVWEGPSWWMRLFW